MTKNAMLVAAGALLWLGAGAAQAQDQVRIGYWASGVSAGIGLVLEEGEFLAREGIKPQWTRFTRLAEVNRAVISKSIDIAVAGGTVPSLRLGAEGVPAKIILANLIADANFVVPEASPIKTLADLKGKKIGSTPPGSTAHALVGTILQRSYGMAPSEYQQVPSGEAQLAVFLNKSEIDAALMRTITLRTIGPQAKLRVIGSIPAEWRKLIKADSPPVLGVALVDEAFAKASPDVVTRYVVAAMKATKWGGENPAAVADILKRRLNMDAAEAGAYAESWKETYFASLEEADMDSLLQMAAIFKGVDNFSDEVTRGIFMPEPYRKAKAIFARTQ
jgi:NitT/TauT family transport system substrate-binding protein